MEDGTQAERHSKAGENDASQSILHRDTSMLPPGEGLRFTQHLLALRFF
jgi:hypothetical protein